LGNQLFACAAPVVCGDDLPPPGSFCRCAAGADADFAAHENAAPVRRGDKLESNET
jgi:hypothetical protein